MRGLFRGARKPTRRKLAKSEGYMFVACTAQRWADEIEGKARVLPFEEWPENDPHRTLARTYGLTKEDLVALFTQIGQELENRAIGLGYDDHWDPLPAQAPRPKARASA